MPDGRTAANGRMKRIQFSVTYPDRLRHPLQRHLEDDEALTRAELLLWSPTADATTLCWFDGEPAAAERAVATIDSIETANHVRDGDGTYVFLQQDGFEFPDVVLDLIADAAVIFRPPVVFRDDGTISFEAVGETSALSAFHDALASVGDLAIERVRSFDRASRPSQLTDRQRAAIEAAVAVGYYEIPREGTIEDVAARLDCATSTAGELVRKAEAAVVEGVVEGQSRSAPHPNGRLP
nr:helix-turn-helix domain-containing protein [Halomicrobium sp. IBSBa]